MKPYYTLFILFCYACAPLFVCAQRSQIIHTYEVNNKKSYIRWKIGYALGSHSGIIKLSSGILETDEQDNIVSGYLIFDMPSITCTDLYGKFAKLLADSAKSTTFLDVSNYPFAIFDIRKVVKNTDCGDTILVSGIFTLKGIHQEITVPTLLTRRDKKMLAITIPISIDRKLFNINFASSSVYEDVGQLFIGDEIDISANIVIKQKEINNSFPDVDDILVSKN